MKFSESIALELKNNSVQHIFKSIVFALFFLFATADILKTFVAFFGLLILGVVINAWVYTFYRKF